MLNKNKKKSSAEKLFKEPFRYDWPLITKEIEESVIQQLHNKISVYDKSNIIGEFEDNFSKYCGSRFSLTTNSGTSALHSAYYAIGLKPGDEVICPAYTFFATAMPLFQLGVLPVLADCLPTGEFDYNEISRLTTDKTKAVVITHMWGFPCNMEKLCEECKKYGLKLIEDCSHAHGAKYKNKVVGTFGDVGIWSLQAQKIITAGEGGILVTDDEEIYDKAQLLGHFHKRSMNEISPKRDYYRFATTGLGLKYRANPLGISIANCQLKYLDSWIRNKQVNAEKIKNIISPVAGIKPLIDVSSNERLCSYYAFVFLVDENKSGFSRERLSAALKKEGLEDINIPKSTSPLYCFDIFKNPTSPVYNYKQNCIRGDYSIAKDIARRSVKLSVPVETGANSRGELFIENFKRIWDKTINNLN